MSFKIGDKVKVIKMEEDLGDVKIRVGQFGVIKNIRHFGKYNIEVVFSDGITWFNEEELTLKQGINVYLAAPFFSENQINKVKLLNAALESNEDIGNIFVPMEHQWPEGLSKSVKEFTPEWAKAVAMNDYKQIRDADILVAIVDFDGQDADSGTAAEIGYAYAIDRPVFLVNFEQHEEMINLMMTEVAHAYFKNGEEVANYDFAKMPKIAFSGSYR